jgi:hypothetical protein
MNSTDWANVFWNTRFPKNFDPFQMIIVPPEFPIDGGIGEVVKCLGTNFLYVLEVQRLLVSCKQIISHPISWYLFLLELHFLELIPLIFWQRVTHSLALDLPCVSITTNKEYIAMGDHIASICPVRKEHLNWHNNVWKRTRDIENTLFMITIRNPYNSRARIRAQISKCVI